MLFFLTWMWTWWSISEWRLGSLQKWLFCVVFCFCLYFVWTLVNVWPLNWPLCSLSQPVTLPFYPLVLLGVTSWAKQTPLFSQDSWKEPAFEKSEKWSGHGTMGRIRRVSTGLFLFMNLWKVNKRLWHTTEIKPNFPFHCSTSFWKGYKESPSYLSATV